MTFTFLFNLIILTAIVADFFFNLDTVGIITLGALPMSTNLSRFFPQSATAPDFTAFPYEHDFVLNGRPQSFKRNADGSLIPAIGEVVETSYGIGYIERRHVDGSYIVRITDYNDREFPRYGNTAINPPTHYVGSAEAVAEMNEIYNARILNRSEWFTYRLNDKAYAEQLLDLLIDDGCYQVCFSRGGDYGGATEFMYDTATNPMYAKKSSAETKAYQARIKVMADKLLADTEDDEPMPEGMADELAEVFGQ